MVRVFANKEPIELKAGSKINLFGNLSFFVENSDELRFYPTNTEGTQMMPEKVSGNSGESLCHSCYDHSICDYSGQDRKDIGI